MFVCSSFLLLLLCFVWCAFITFFSFHLFFVCVLYVFVGHLHVFLVFFLSCVFFSLPVLFRDLLWSFYFSDCIKIFLSLFFYLPKRNDKIVQVMKKGTKKHQDSRTEKSHETDMKWEDLK